MPDPGRETMVELLDSMGPLSDEDITSLSHVKEGLRGLVGVQPLRDEEECYLCGFLFKAGETTPEKIDQPDGREITAPLCRTCRGDVPTWDEIENDEVKA